MSCNHLAQKIKVNMQTGLLGTLLGLQVRLGPLRQPYPRQHYHLSDTLTGILVTIFSFLSDTLHLAKSTYVCALILLHVSSRE